MQDEPNYIYYIIQVGEQFAANRDCEYALTEDEEQARAFTTHDAAVLQANGINGIVQQRTVYETELQALTEQHHAEYVTLPLAEREEIVLFCQQLTKL